MIRRGATQAGPGESRIAVGDATSIDASELSFTFQRSSGPGGQNVNKVNTRATLYFNVDLSPSLSDRQKSTIRQRLATRISRDGVLRVVSSKHRTQEANRRAAVARFAELLELALHEDKPRRKTKTPAAAKRRRRDEKRMRSETKRLRRQPGNAAE